MRKSILVLLGVGMVLCSCKNNETETPETGGAKMELKVMSRAFEDKGMIPSKYTCDGEDISPAIAWENVPDGTKSIALISDDPDAPVGTWVHWVLFNLPGDSNGLDENVPGTETLQTGAIQGLNSWGRTGYSGPCPPSGTHRYFFKVYALDAMLNLDSKATKKDLLEAMARHILAEGQVMGKYKRK